MADIKISALSQVSEVQSTDVVPVVSGNFTMKMSAAQVKDYCVGDLDVSDTATAGSYVTAVNETNGVIAVTREAADGTPTNASTKMVTSGGVYSALSSKAEKSTISDAYNASTAYAVGDHFIYNDVIYTVDVACTGITPPNANYYTANNLTDLIEANTSQISTLNSSINNKVDWKSNGMLGAKNLLPNTANTQVVDDVTFTVNNDGSVTINGATTSSVHYSAINLCVNVPLSELGLKKGANYILSSGLSSTYLRLVLLVRNSSQTVIQTVLSSTSSSELSIPNDAAYITARIDCLKGYTANNDICYPMLRLTSDTNDTYQPYAMTNQQLTSKVAPIACDQTSAGTYTLSATVDSDGNVTYLWS